MASTQQASASTNIIPGVSQNMSLKIGRSSAELARPCFTAGTSRVARSRAAKALGLRKRKVVSPQSPPSPNQESAMNPKTGKVAFGPWLGPYESAADAAIAAGPLFLDHNGNTYASLNAPGSLKGVVPPQPQPMQAPSGKAPAAAASQQLYAMVSKMSQRHAAATAQAHGSKPRRGQGKPHSGGRCSNTMARSINQPRRS